MDLGPVEILYTWHAVLLAVGVSVVTTAIKRGVNIALGGKDRRKANPWVTEVVLPLVPLLFGGVGAVIVPLHPDKLIEYVAAHPRAPAWMIYAAWGAAVGVFSDYLYQRANRLLQALVPSKAAAAALTSGQDAASGASLVPPVASENEPKDPPATE